MEQRRKTLKVAARAALYQTLRKKHQNRRRWMVSFQSIGIIIVFVLTAVLQVYFQIKPPTYALDQTIYNLIGQSRDDTQLYLTDSQESQAYIFEVPEQENAESSVHGGREADVYRAAFSKDASKGITYTDSANNIDISLSPKFKSYEGRKVDGDHIVYLLSGGAKLIYTLKYNGLKEDIIIPEFQGDELDFEFELSLPSGVEARLDAQGNLGIYSADPTLFGNISFGTDEDRAMVDKARENGEKNNLIASIPFPIVKDSSGKEYSDKAQFKLGKSERKNADIKNKDIPSEVQKQLATQATRNSYTLGITSNGLKELAYPISIDPTIQSTSANTFREGNIGDGTTVDDGNGLIKRSALTGGVLNSWTTDADTFTTTRWAFGASVYNGRIYITGGGDSNLADIQYTTIASDGTTGVWSSAGSNMLVGRSGHEMEIVDGYVYILGGSSGGARRNDVDYAKIDPSTGQLLVNAGCGSQWCDANTFTTERTNFQSVHHNGYLYIIGGWSNASTLLNNVQYAKVKTDGTLGAWTATTTLNLGRRQHAATTYNGYVYVAGGSQNTFNANGVSTSIEYAKFNSDGTLTSWTTNSTALVTARDTFGLTAISGYLYINGGCFGYDGDGDCNSIQSSGEYASIHADGSVGTPRTATNMNGSRGDGEVLSYNDRIYALGGCGVDASNDGSCQTKRQDIEYTTVRSAGYPANWETQTNQFANGRERLSAAAYNGFLYIAGGCTGGCEAGETFYNDLQYAPINADGSLGTWVNSGQSFGGTGRGDSEMRAYNGYLYISGGHNVNGLGAATFYNTTFRSQLNHTTGAPGAWQSLTNSFSTARTAHGMEIYNDYIYILGGRDNSNVFSDVQYAPLNPTTGDTSAAFQSTTAMPSDNLRFGLKSVNGRLYTIGGCSAVDVSQTCTTSLNQIRYATYNSNGTISSWTTNATNIPHTTYDFGSGGFINGLFYIHGGDGAGRPEIEFATLSSDGSVGSWSLGPTLARRGDPETLSVGNYFYIVGGGTSRTVDRILINNGGSNAVSSWTVDASSPLVTPRGAHGSAVYNGYLYAVGGENSTAENEVEYAPINSDGSVGTWVSTSVMPAARTKVYSVAYNGYLYAIGGCTSSACGTVEQTVYYAQITSNGSLAANSGCGSSWCTTSALNTARGRHWGGVSNGYLYAVGGADGSGDLSSVEYASINANGSVNTWQTTTSLPTGRRLHRTVVYNGYMYVAGGSVGGTYDNATLYAPLGTDGTVGTWVNGPRFFKARGTSALVAYGGYLYLLGGYDGTTIYNDVQVAALYQGGALGNWEKATAFTDSRYGHAVQVYNGRMYLYGGYDGGLTKDDTQYASLRSIPRVGRYSRLFDFGSAVKPTKVISRGTKQNNGNVSLYYSNSDESNTDLGTTTTHLDISYGGSNNNLTVDLGSNITTSRYFRLGYILDDSFSTVFPDSGNQTTLTDYDVYFTANPGQRLRGGRTFTNGVDRGLNAQPQ